MFASLVDYVRTNMNLVEFEVHGRYVKELFDDNQGGCVAIEVFDYEPQVVHRPGLPPVYRNGGELVNG